jgi:hypothetical protein
MVLSSVMLLMSRVGMQPPTYLPPPVTWVEAWAGIRNLQDPLHYDPCSFRPPPKPPPDPSQGSPLSATVSSSSSTDPPVGEGDSPSSSVSVAEGDAPTTPASIDEATVSSHLPSLLDPPDDDSSVTSVDGEGDDDTIASNDDLFANGSVDFNQPKCMSQEDLDSLHYCQFISGSSLSTNDPLLSNWKDLPEHVTADWKKTVMFCFLSPWSAHSFGPLGFFSDIDRAIYAVVDTGASMCVTFCREDFIHYEPTQGRVLKGLIYMVVANVIAWSQIY